MCFLPEVIGRERLKQQLFQIQQDERIKAILFYGANGVGKHFIAQAFARSLLCKGEAALRQQGACGNCFSCQLWQEEGHPDFTDLKPEPKEKIIQTDRLREEVLADIHYTPRFANRRVFVIDANSLNEVGQNVLLKTLEEMPNDAYILLTVNQPEQLLITVRSRCLLLHVEALSAVDLAEVLAKHLGEKWQEDLTEDKLSWLQSVCLGSPGLALQYLNNGAFEASEIFLKQLPPAFLGKTVLSPFVHLSQVMQNKEWIDLYLSLLLQVFAIISHARGKKLHLGASFGKKERGDSLNQSLVHATTMTTTPFWNQLLSLGEQLIAQKNFSPTVILNSMQYITEAKEALTYHVNMDLVIHRLLLKLGKEMTHA